MSEDSKTLTGDGLLFQTILMSMKSKPEIDWTVVAEKVGYKDARSARTRYGQIMKKLTGLTGAEAIAGTGSSTKKTPAKAKGTVGSGTNTTPSKVRKSRAKPTAAKKNGKTKNEEAAEKNEHEGGNDQGQGSDDMEDNEGDGTGDHSGSAPLKSISEDNVEDGQDTEDEFYQEA